jgi:predicted DNA binding protein
MIPEKQRKLLVEQLRKTPIVQVACQKLGIHRATYYRWRLDSPDFAAEADAAIVEGELMINDLAESQLISAIQNQNLHAITFWLKNHHAKYGTKVELSGMIETKAGQLTPEQEELVRKALRIAAPDYGERPPEQPRGGA